MQGWTYTGDTRINIARKTDDGQMSGVVWFHEIFKDWRWHVSTIKDGQVKIIGSGSGKSARLCIEMVHAMLNV